MPPGAGCSLLCHAPLQSTASAAQTNCAVTVMHGYYIINNLYGSQTFYGMKALYLLKLERGILLCAPNIHIKSVFNICQLLVVLA